MAYILSIAIFINIASYNCLNTKFQGYHYSKPTERASRENDTNILPQNDFVNDLIMEHKQQIVSSILDDVPSHFQIGNKSFIRNKCAECACGVPNVSRIVGGSKVRTNKYPWTAQILRGHFQFCGGTVINDRYVMTAAHCITSKKSISIRLLQLDKNSRQEGVIRKISSIQVHRAFNEITLQHDIALLKLETPLLFKNQLRPICLPSSLDQNFDFRQGIVAGWGLNSEDGLPSDYLQEVTVPIITNTQCRSTTYKEMIVETMLCAGYPKGGKDACQGDSGGPLIVRDGTTVFRLAGIVSYGFGCAAPHTPGVYTRVSKYLDWISANTRDACYCIK
uniref:Peptidase S1 domain-containing protein n=1 Tax=Glossina brevipalpis TaxID=37001 RepID=A0A1A9WE67_9MUSC